MTKKIGVSLRQELYDWAAREVEEGRAESVSALIAQGLELWRGGPRQANVGRLISAGRAGGSPVIVDELTPGRAKQIGVTIGATSHPDIVDVHVALAAAERGHAVLTSDDGDIAGINSELILVHV
jgi:Arc/MetJ-type ribon-helix-helix transcriptional regulator